MAGTLPLTHDLGDLAGDIQALDCLGNGTEIGGSRLRPRNYTIFFLKDGFPILI